MPPLYILRAKWEEHYDCPDNGKTEICDKYNDIAISHDKAKLEEMAKKLTIGHTDQPGGYWTEKRADELRAIYPRYEFEQVDYTYTVDDVSAIVI